MSLSSKDEDDIKIRELFNRLDKNKDGKIEFHELKEALTEMNHKKSKKKLSEKDTTKEDEYAKTLYSSMTQGAEHLDFRDFVSYISQKDKKIEIVFGDLDFDKNGIIDSNEIKRAFEKLNIILSEDDVAKLINHIDTNKSLRIDWDEWRDFFRFAPNNHLEEMLRHWRTDTYLDLGEQPLPNDYTKKEKESGLWWRNLVAGGMAGVISRTCTAPLDRVKIFMQVKFMSVNR